MIHRVDGRMCLIVFCHHTHRLDILSGGNIPVWNSTWNSLMRQNFGVPPPARDHVLPLSVFSDGFSVTPVLASAKESHPLFFAASQFPVAHSIPCFVSQNLFRGSCNLEVSVRRRLPRNSQRVAITCRHKFFDERKMMLASVARRRVVSRAIRAHSTQVDKTGSGPIAEDGRHEVWREGIYDHDNEPK